MYPQRELIRLAAHKIALRRDIAACRAQSTAAASRVVQPLEWLDRALAFWRRISPVALLAAVPLGFMVKRTVLPRGKVLGSLVRWAPLVFSAVRGIRSAMKIRRESSLASPEKR